jgi:hypothetical protein
LSVRPPFLSHFAVLIPNSVLFYSNRRDANECGGSPYLVRRTWVVSFEGLRAREYDGALARQENGYVGGKGNVHKSEFSSTALGTENAND